MHNTGYKSALARRVCRYSDARPPRKTDGVLLESEIPPHMRGKAEPKRLWQLSGGITPAYAGKSNLLPHTRCRSWDHPRICGEKAIQPHTSVYRVGSPPHMRGKGNQGCSFCSTSGITPAYAGKRRQRPSTNCVRQDHPRVCGEKASKWWLLSTPPGSPPRMRGKDGRCQRLMKKLRITPAYAGKSLWPVAESCTRWDHPRVCGEKFRAYVKIWNEWGSLPRMRGKDTRLPKAVGFHGITPAYAGKSRPWRPSSSPPRDHPRVCGEKTNMERKEVLP